MNKESIWWVILFIILLFSIFLMIYIESWENGFKTDRQICEENGGLYVEDLSSHHQSQCIYGLKGDSNE